MSTGFISRRAALAASFVTAAAAGIRANAGEARGRPRTSAEDKYLQAALAFWKTFDGEPPYSEKLLAMFTDDCIVRVGEEGNIVAESKFAAKTMFQGFDRNRYKIDVTRTFVSGRVVITEFDFSSWQNKGDTPKQAPGHYLGMYVFKGDKIWMWSDVKV